MRYMPLISQNLTQSKFCQKENCIYVCVSKLASLVQNLLRILQGRKDGYDLSFRRRRGSLRFSVAFIYFMILH